MDFLETDRLILRLWKPEDVDPFAALCADPEVMEYFPALLSREEVVAMIERMKAAYDKDGFSFMACDRKDTGEFIGFVGCRMSFNPVIGDGVEIGWRLSKKNWGFGFAPEAARAVIEYAFLKIKTNEVFAITTVENWKSRKVMEKIGMSYEPNNDFDHPQVPDGSPLKRHVFYRIKSK